MEGEMESVLGDMTPDEFREQGHRVVDWIADYLSDCEQWPVVSRVKPGEIKERIPSSPPEAPEGMGAILDDFEEVIVPGITHWNHPGFFAYFAITGSAPGILAETLCAALNVNGMLWKTSPSATELEEVTLDWLRQMVGLPEGFWGIIFDTASTSTLHALAAAREAVPGLEARDRGLTTPGTPRLRMYTSEQAHSSVEKAAIAIGIGRQGVRTIAVDARFRMDPAALRRVLEEDKQAGWHPFCVVATVGTTSTTSVDPVEEIADICEEFGLWLHVDAAYAGAAALLPEYSWVSKGWDRADSVVTNPHKWLFTPIDLSAFFCRRPELLKSAFSLTPEYLKTNVEGSVTDYMDYGLALGRRFRALKLWMVIRCFGRSGLESRIRQHISWARDFAEWIDQSRDFERMAPTDFSTVCFRAAPQMSGERVRTTSLNSLNERLLEGVNRSGEVFLSHTRLHDQYTLRLSIGNLKTKRVHIEKAKSLLLEELGRLEQLGA